MTDEIERFTIPYPGDGDGKILQPGNLYDIEEWRIFLELHDLDINDVYQIHFQDNGRFTVYRYRRALAGSLFLDPRHLKDVAPKAPFQDVATQDPLTLTPKAPFPAWS